MRNIWLPLLLICFGFAVTVQSCKSDEDLTIAPGTPNQSFTEEFDTVSSALARGWKIVNASVPKGPNIWQQGGSPTPWFPAFSSTGSFAGFIGADYESVQGGPGTISNWLISPVVIMQNGDKIIFYTRSWSIFDGVSDTTDFGNSLQLRVNTSNESLNVGEGTTTGDFNNLLLVINPTLIYSSSANPSPNGYPTRWTRFEGTISSLNASAKGRFAFRFYVTDGGLCASCNGQGIAIDKVQYQSIK